MPESMFITFAPTGSSDGTWEINKLGEWINVGDVVTGGDQHMHSVYSGLSKFKISGILGNLIALQAFE